jgi:DNA repair protein REV1
VLSAYRASGTAHECAVTPVTRAGAAPRPAAAVYAKNMAAHNSCAVTRTMSCARPPLPAGRGGGGGARRGVNHYDDFGEYMAVKLRKLSEQLEKPAAVAPEDASAGSAASRLFAGVSIYVDGRTDPPNLALRDMVCARGGDYQYYQVPAVTHVVATHLPDAKVRLLRGHERVVHPDWIVQSCARGQLLPWETFALYRGRLPSQRALGFVRTSAPAPAPAPVPPAKGAVHAEDGNLPAAAAEDDHHDNESDDDDGGAPAMDEDEDEDVGLRALTGAAMVEREAAAFQSDRAWVQQVVSTHPDFIARYFATSRLHFLSTWKNELTQLVGTMAVAGATGAAGAAAAGRRRLLFHVDMDCFFVSVGLRDRPHLRDQPVGVSHSKGALSEGASAEIGTASRSVGTWVLKVCA